jgi:hypothetical protein
MDLYMQIQFSDQNGAGIYIFIALALMQINTENKHLNFTQTIKDLIPFLKGNVKHHRYCTTYNDSLHALCCLKLSILL